MFWMFFRFFVMSLELDPKVNKLFSSSCRAIAISSFTLLFSPLHNQIVWLLLTSLHSTWSMPLEIGWNLKNSTRPKKFISIIRFWIILFVRFCNHSEFMKIKFRNNFWNSFNMKGEKLLNIEIWLQKKQFKVFICTMKNNAIQKIEFSKSKRNRR